MLVAFATLSLLALPGCSSKQPLVRTELRTVSKLELIPVPAILLDPCLVPALPTIEDPVEGTLVDRDKLPAYMSVVFGILELCNEQLSLINWLYEQQENKDEGGNWYRAGSVLRVLARTP